MSIDPKYETYIICVFCFLILLLSGCATQQVATPVEVKIPVPIKCTTEAPISPKPVSCYQDTGKANWREDFIVNGPCMIYERKMSEAYELELLAALNSCK